MGKTSIQGKITPLLYRLGGMIASFKEKKAAARAAFWKKQGLQEKGKKENSAVGAQHFTLRWAWARRGFQVLGENSASIGNSSSRPASMSKLSSHLHQGEKSAKEPIGPTISSPGPTL